jgi:transcriptional regulator with XRE-family HTH domain
MAKKKPTSPLPMLCEQRGLSPADLAHLAGIDEATVAEWGRSLDTVTPVQLRNLACLFGTPIPVLLGRDVTDAEEASGTFAAYVPSGGEYGTLKLSVAGQSVEYPVAEAARETLLTQLSSFDIQDDSNASAWLATSTLDNKLVYANPAFVQQVELISEAAEATPDYEHPEVYLALEDWELDENVGPVLRAQCTELMQLKGREAVLQEVLHARIVMGTGDVTWHALIEEDDSTGFYLLELEAQNGIPCNRFLRVATEGYHRARYVNLSAVALVEVPANRYLRLLAEGNARESTD